MVWTERGLAPLPDPHVVGESSTTGGETSESKSSAKKSKESNIGLSFSTSGPATNKSRKRKIIDTDPDFEQFRESVSGKKDKEKGGKANKKPKKEKKTLLSFGEDA